MSTPNSEQEVERLSQIIENLNFVNANQAQELSMKSAHLAHAREIYQKAIQERDDLRGWKESMMRVESEWSEQQVARLLDLPLGSSCRAGIQRAVERLLEDRKADLAQIIRLIKENEELKARLELQKLNPVLHDCTCFQCNKSFKGARATSSLCADCIPF